MARSRLFTEYPAALWNSRKGKNKSVEKQKSARKCGNTGYNILLIKALAKEFRKKNGTRMPAEIILIGGAMKEDIMGAASKDYVTGGI